MKRRGPSTDPWGTPSGTAEHLDLRFLSWTCCWLSVRYDKSQVRRSRSSGWEMMSKAAVRSRRMRMVSNPESAARRRSLVVLTKAISALCLRRKPDWKGSWRLFESR